MVHLARGLWPVAGLVLLTPSAGYQLARHPAKSASAHRSIQWAPLPTAPRRAPPPRAVANAPELEEQLLDLGSLGRYLFAVLIQLTLISTSFGFVDVFCYGPLPGQVQLGGPLPSQAVIGIFLALSVGSRLFNPLDNSRPDLRSQVSAEDDAALRKQLEGGKQNAVFWRAECEKRGLLVDRTMVKAELLELMRQNLDETSPTNPAAAQGRLEPSWTPPGVVFPLMWVGVVAPLRAFASSLVYEASTGRLNEGHLNDPVLLWLVFHLCLGDTWNTINNVERRMGAAVPGVVCVWLSTLFAVKQYYDVAPLAGGLLAVSAVWITVAGALVADTWRINNELVPEPLFPWKKKGRRSETRFFFEE